jgi:hypothetical protein
MGTEVPKHRIQPCPSVLSSNHQSGGKRAQVADSTLVTLSMPTKCIVIIYIRENAQLLQER